MRERGQTARGRKRGQGIERGRERERQGERGVGESRRETDRDMCRHSQQSTSIIKKMWEIFSTCFVNAMGKRVSSDEFRLPGK